MDYSNFVRNFFRIAVSRLQAYPNYYGKIVNLGEGLDIPSEFIHEEEPVNKFLPSFSLNINAPTKYFIDFMDYYVRMMPDLGMVFASKKRINDLYNEVVDMGILDDDEYVTAFIYFMVIVGIKALAQQGILEA